jgi:quinol monooxygenase YgiN
MKNNKIITLVELSINPEFIDDVIQKATATRDLILLEKGCEAFNLTRKKDDPKAFVIFAIYASKEAYEWHLEQDYIKTFFEFLNGKLTAQPQTNYLEEI